MKKNFLLLPLITSLSFSLFSGCVQPVIAPGNKPITGSTSIPSSGTQGTSAENDLTVNKALSLEPLATEKNMARLPGVIVNVSSTYEGWDKERLNDGVLDTSWFTNIGDAANLGKSPFVQIVFPQVVSVQGVNFRGNREYNEGYDILEGILTLTDKDGKNYPFIVKLPPPDRDFNVKFKNKFSNIVSLKFTFTKDESNEPGFAEIEVEGSK